MYCFEPYAADTAPLRASDRAHQAAGIHLNLHHKHQVPEAWAAQYFGQLSLAVWLLLGHTVQRCRHIHGIKFCTHFLHTIQDVPAGQGACTAWQPLWEPTFAAPDTKAPYRAYGGAESHPSESLRGKGAQYEVLF